MPAAKGEMLPAAEFWKQLEGYGLITTDAYTADGKARFCKKKDGELCLVSVHDEYPDYIVDKVLSENGFMDIPLYNNIN